MHAVVDVLELTVNVVGLEVDKLVFYVANGEKTLKLVDELVVRPSIDQVWVLVGIGALRESQSLV